MSNKLKAFVDPLAGGEHSWYMAGGGAAWWHIIDHMTFWHGAHEWDYFRSVENEIFPGDIEGGALKQVTSSFASKQGVIDVSLSETKQDIFDEIIQTHCENVDGIYVYKPKSIIVRYSQAGNENKKNKRDIRVAMLKLKIAGQPITELGVEQNKPKGGGFLAAIKGANLKSFK